MPDSTELARAYSQYYTHQTQKTERQEKQSILKTVYYGMINGYLHHRYGYYNELKFSFLSQLWPLIYFMPIRRQSVDQRVMRLSSSPGGRLLEVGCGAGVMLRQMADLGWEVAGVDPDPKACTVARSHDLEIKCGSLEEAMYPSDYFDAVIMNHVLEHIGKPYELLKECFRVLRPGGRIVITTPNAASLGHRFFRTAWRGIEAPRHLFIFTPGSLQMLLNSIGFESISQRTIVSPYVLDQSALLMHWPKHLSKLGKVSVSHNVLVTVFMLLEMGLLPVTPYIGEHIFSQSLKPASAAI
jgi:2-polyprenyl-3-methyl-5-hydroxy-6-metoxy-1,4-benzoquinol methylase